MEDKSVVITGANSYLGSTLVRYLIERTQWCVYALVSHRSTGSLPGPSHPRLTVLQADLTQAVPKTILQALNRANGIVHFAWTRDQRLNQTCTLNWRMIELLFECTSDRSALRFISSVAASPSAQSVYGRAKFKTAQYVVRHGGVAIACGLVVDDPPRGPYALLSRCVKSLPLSVRFTDQGPLVYPIGIDTMCARLAESIDVKIEPGTYKLWGSPVPLNLFLIRVERDFPRRRLSVPINTWALISIASLMVGLRLPPRALVDKVLTLLHKDEGYLGSLPDLPNADGLQPVTLDQARQPGNNTNCGK